MGELQLLNDLVELYRKTATELPEDILIALKNSKDNIIQDLIKNSDLAKNLSKPICQDTGTPIFYIKHDKTYSQKELKEIITQATKKATEQIPLRPNAVNIETDKNSGNNTGDKFPIIYFEEINKGLIIDLMLKGGGSENVGQTYKLPNTELKAERNMEGIKKCVLDAVFKAQGKACPPYIIGVAAGGSKDILSFLSKKQLLRKLNDETEFESQLKQDINKLGIGALGFGGEDTCLSIKYKETARHPASFFVDISFCCWACRRGSLKYD
jgi:fumarate hydratase, class I